MKIGIGYEVHALVLNRKLIIGGDEIPYEMELDRHWDADALIHAVMCNLLGAMGEGDIGRIFPDSDNQYKGIDSRILLRKVAIKMQNNGYKLGNLDAVIIAQKPKMSPFIEEMK